MLSFVLPLQTDDISPTCEGGTKELTTAKATTPTTELPPEVIEKHKLHLKSMDNYQVRDTSDSYVCKCT